MFVNQYTINNHMHGIEMHAIHSTVARNTEDAEDGFVDAKERLLDVTNWPRYMDVTGAGIRLTDGHGRPVKRRAHKGDHIKISLQGIKECCVVIDALEYDDYPDIGMETFTMRIRLCAHGSLANDDEYDPAVLEAGLIIERRGRQLDAAFLSRNAVAGLQVPSGEPLSLFGLTEAQWNKMLANFIVTHY